MFSSGLATCARPDYYSDQKPYWIIITNKENGHKARCLVNDRGPNGIPGRVLDVSPVVRDALGFGGLTNVEFQKEMLQLTKGST